MTERDAETTLEAAADCGLFEAEELTILGERLRAFLAGRPESGELWIADFDDRGRALGVALCVEEAMTDRVWNLLFIGVRTSLQNQGVGGRLLGAVEERLRTAAQRMLVIDTTVGPPFDGVHAFYRSNGYTQEGTVRDFFASGSHRVTFRKLLGS